MEIQHASEDFERFLAEAQDLAGLATRNQTYTMVEAVLRVFRSRLAVEHALRFADVLPPILRAIFVAEWRPDDPVRPFVSRLEMTREVQLLRRHHNFAPETSIRDVAQALRGHCDETALDYVLGQLSPAAAEFWQVSE